MKKFYALFLPHPPTQKIQINKKQRFFVAGVYNNLGTY